MRTLAYGFFLVFLALVSIVLLRSLRPEQDPDSVHKRLAELRDQGATTIDVAQLANATPAELYELGVDYYQFWRVREAVRLLERAVERDSTMYGAWLKLAECYANPLVANEPALNRALIRAQATAPSPRDTLTVSGMRMLYQEYDYAGAIAAFSAALRVRANDTDARYHLAESYLLLGRLEDAGKHIDHLMRSDDTVGPVVELAIRRSAAARDFPKAAESARELARLYTEEAFPYVLIAQVELARGNRVGAVEFCGNALDLDPNCVPAILTRAFLYADADQFEAARVSCEKLMMLEDTHLRSIGHEGVAFVDFLAGDFEAGVGEMDEAIRHAMMANSGQRGLALAARLVEYLCQLGQADRAEAVVERWVTGFGDVPVRLTRVRIQALRGDSESTTAVLEQLTTDKAWLLEARALGIDVAELAALAEIARQRQTQALTMLAATAKEATPVAAGAAARRAFLVGYAAFENGDAETAASSFAQVRARLYGPEFPYHGDPVLAVQSLFFLAESELASGGHAAARENYEAFLRYWGEAAWDLEAVARARKKLEALGTAGVVPQG